MLRQSKEGKGESVRPKGRPGPSENQASQYLESVYRPN